MNKPLLAGFLRTSVYATLLSGILFGTSAIAQTAAPPSLGEETKGAPAIAETSDTSNSSEANPEEAQDVEPEQKRSNNPFGTSTVTEYRRENGQRHLIELEHSSGIKQYIEETDSDGKIESTDNGIEETPNLPKWKIGSW